MRRQNGMWKIKAVKDAAKAALPFQLSLRRLKRVIRPYTDNPTNSSLALHQGLQQIDALRKAGCGISGDILELGSGWLPIIPILFQIAGARKLILTDIERLMDAHTVELAKKVIAANAAKVAQDLGISESAVRRGLGEPFLPDYRVDWAPSQTPSGSVDAIISRTVLEHVRPNDMEMLFTEFARMLRPDGAMCHIIDNSDHWEHRDKAISRVNFLRYEERDLLWKLACFNPQMYQNRMRHSDYAQFFRRLGWKEVLAAGEPDRKVLQDLEELQLARAFRDRDRQDLAILTSLFVLRREKAGEPQIALDGR